MDDPAQFAVALLLRVGHILPAIVLVGAVFFMRLAYLPALESLSEEDRTKVSEATAAAWSPVIMFCAALLLLTGIVNAVLNIRAFTFGIGGIYHGLALAKFLLALGMLYISSTLAGRSEAAQEYRKNMPFWLNVNVTLAILTILVAGVMKVTDHIPKPAVDPAPATNPAEPGS